jgi:hypothetical protein
MTQSPTPGDPPPVDLPTGTTPGSPLGDPYASGPATPGTGSGTTEPTGDLYGGEPTPAMPPQSPSATDVAKDEAAGVKETAKQAGSKVAQTASGQASEVAGEARRQARDLLQESRSELNDQASQQQHRAARGLRSLGEELHGMADGAGQQGVASDLARQAAERTSALAAWLEDREPGALLDEARDFARRRPMAFLAIAAGAGVLAGRLGRGLQADSQASGTTAAPAQHRADYATGGQPGMPYPPPPTGQPRHGGVLE